MGTVACRKQAISSALKEIMFWSHISKVPWVLCLWHKTCKVWLGGGVVSRNAVLRYSGGFLVIAALSERG